MNNWNQLNSNLNRLRFNIKRKRSITTYGAGAGSKQRLKRTSPRERLSLVEQRSKDILRTRLIVLSLLVLTRSLLIWWI